MMKILMLAAGGRSKVTNIPIMEMRANCGKYKRRCKYTHTHKCRNKKIGKTKHSKPHIFHKHDNGFAAFDCKLKPIDNFQHKFGVSRQLWNVVFQNQVWHKTQTLNPANPGMAPEPGSRLGKLFFYPLCHI